MKNFAIYRASAGSGKTYTLTYNYLRLALKYPDNYKHILAVTFTNKATEEMKARIISTLKLLRRGDHPMSASLVEDLHISEKELSQRADALLKKILHNYSFFSVSTIDTFFQRIVRSFAREMGVQTGFKIELDQSKVLDDVIDKLLKNVSDDPALVSWLTQFALSKLAEGKSWETKKDITDLARELFREDLIADKEAIFGRLVQKDFGSVFVHSLYEKRRAFENEYQQFGRDIVNLLNRFDLDPSDLNYGLSGVGGYIIKVANGAFKEPTNRAKTAVEEDVWYSKTSKQKHAIDAATSAGLAQLVGDMISYYEHHSKEYFSIVAVVKNIYAFGLLARVSNGIDQYRSENDLLLISDFPIILNQIISDSDSPFIYEKTGTRYQHFLIDEFQDTSQLQWQNFRPLIADSLSQNNFNMVVGDVKQSIYRWRGGDWRILLEGIIRDVRDEYVSQQSLSTNRRSKENIVRFNNRLFEESPRQLEYKLTDKLNGNGDLLRLQSAYIGASQELYDESSEGQIDMCWVTSQADEEDDRVEQLLEAMIDRINFLQDHHYQPRDIAILVRNSTHGKLVADRLVKATNEGSNDRYDYCFVSNETLALKNNSAVNLILMALEFVVLPQDQIKLAQLRYAGSHHGVSSAKIEEYIERHDEVFFQMLTEHVTHIIRHFDLLHKSDDMAYVMAFQDAIMDYLQYEPDSVLEFLDWWEQNCKRSIQLSDDLNAIRIMTVHKSKGLQFKAVLIPFCHWKLDYSVNQRPLLWGSAAEIEELKTLPKVPIRYASELEQTIFCQSYYQEKNDVYLDNLNLLYVAVTRAEEYLYLGGKVGKGLDSVADLVLKIEDPSSFNEEANEFTKTIGRIPSHTAYEVPQAKGYELTPLARSSSQSAGLQLRQQQRLLEDAVQKSVDYGEIVHWLLSQIEFKSDFTKALQLAVVRYSLSDDELNDIRQMLRRAWELPGVSGWFDDKWKVKNEASILMADGQLKRPDRVIIDGDVVWVIDYKTGQQSTSHISQVKSYMEVMQLMGYSVVRGFLLYLTSLEVIEI